MRILQRYILREFLQPLAYCLATFSLLYILLQLFDVFPHIIQGRPSAAVVATFFLATLAPFFDWIFPASFLLATLYTVWRLCRNSEISAMRASGISFPAITAPILLASLVFTLLSFCNSQCLVPRLAERAVRIGKNKFDSASLTNATQRVSYYNASGLRRWQVDGFNPSRPRVLRDVSIKFERPDRTARYEIKSPAAHYLDGVWWFQTPSEQSFDEHEMPLPARAPRAVAPSLRAFPQLNETPHDFQDETASWDYLSYTARRRYIHNHPKLPADTRASYTYDMHSRLSTPWACLVMTLFAIPAGIATGRQSVAKGVLAAILMFFTYYALTILFMLLAKQQLLPPLAAAWLPNLLFLAIGLLLFHRQR